MKDQFDRNIDYLRISITDRCNLRCRYCIPSDMGEGFTHFAHGDILQYEEFLRVAEIMAGLGVNTFRITGGEPLVRKEVAQFVKNLKNLPSRPKVTLTTNGILLSSQLPALVDAGINGLNISLDSASAINYENITGQDQFAAVWESIKQAVAAGITVKLNTVIIQGINCHEIVDMVDLVKDFDISLRFIELMPTGANTDLVGVPTRHIIDTIQGKYGQLTPASTASPGPAQYYTNPNIRGSIGTISPINHSFCQGCNRLRISSTGFLRLCLHHNDGINLRDLLRTGATDDMIRDKIASTVTTKPREHLLDSHIAVQDMSKIGG